MTIASEITRLQGAKADLKTSIEAKGVTVPSSATIDTYSGYVDQIQQGSGNKLTVTRLAHNNNIGYGFNSFMRTCMVSPGVIFRLYYSADPLYLRVYVDDFTGDTITLGKAYADISSPSSYQYSSSSWIVRESNTTAILIMHGEYDSSDDFIFRISYDGSSVSVSSLGQISKTNFSGYATPAVVNGYLLLWVRSTYGAILPVNLSTLAVGTSVVTLGTTTDNGDIKSIDGRIFVAGTGSNYSGIAEISLGDDGTITVLHNTSYTSDRTGISSYASSVYLSGSIIDVESGKAAVVLPVSNLLGGNNYGQYCSHIEFGLSNCELSENRFYSGSMSGPAVAIRSNSATIPAIVSVYGKDADYVAVLGDSDYSRGHFAVASLSELQVSTVAKPSGSNVWLPIGYTTSYHKAVHPYHAWLSGDEMRLALYYTTAGTSDAYGTNLFSFILGS